MSVARLTNFTLAISLVTSATQSLFNSETSFSVRLFLEGRGYLLSSSCKIGWAPWGIFFQNAHSSAVAADVESQISHPIRLTLAHTKRCYKGDKELDLIKKNAKVRFLKKVHQYFFDQMDHILKKKFIWWQYHWPMSLRKVPCSNSLPSLEHLFVWTNVSLIGCDLTFYISRNCWWVCILKKKCLKGPTLLYKPLGRFSFLKTEWPKVHDHKLARLSVEKFLLWADRWVLRFLSQDLCDCPVLGICGQLLVCRLMTFLQVWWR